MSLSSLSLPTLSLALVLTAACSRSDTTRSDTARVNTTGTSGDVTSSAPTGPGGVDAAAANGSGPTRLNADASGSGPVRIDASQVPGATAPAVGLGDTTYVDSMVGGGAVRTPVPGVAGAPPGGVILNAAPAQTVGNGPGFNSVPDGSPIAGVAPTVTPTAAVTGTSNFGTPPGRTSTTPTGPINQANGPGTIPPPGANPDNRPGMDPSNPASPVAPPAGVVPMR